MDPEFNRERIETYFEKRRLSENIVEELRENLKLGHEYSSDIVGCPNPSCRYPLQIKLEQDEIRLVCINCGFKQNIPVDKD